MSAADEFRQHAAACIRAAQLTGVAGVKATLIDMAQHWNRLAERMDRLAVTGTLVATYRSETGSGPTPAAPGESDRQPNPESAPV